MTHVNHDGTTIKLLGCGPAWAGYSTLVSTCTAPDGPLLCVAATPTVEAEMSVTAFAAAAATAIATAYCSTGSHTSDDASKHADVERHHEQH